MNDKGKKVFFSLIGVFILLIAVIGMSYALWQRSFIGTKENSVKTGYVSFSYVESDSNVITIENALPMKDEVGKNQIESNEMFDFSISSNYGYDGDINYEIYTVDGNNNTLPPEYLKVYLTDQNDNALEGYDTTVPVYANLEQTSDGNGRYLFKSKLDHVNSSKNFRLRVWIDSSYNDAVNTKRFSFKVNVKSSI